MRAASTVIVKLLYTRRPLRDNQQAVHRQAVRLLCTPKCTSLCSLHCLFHLAWWHYDREQILEGFSPAKQQKTLQYSLQYSHLESPRLEVTAKPRDFLNLDLDLVNLDLVIFTGPMHKPKTLLRRRLFLSASIKRSVAGKPVCSHA